MDRLTLELYTGLSILQGTAEALWLLISTLQNGVKGDHSERQKTHLIGLR